MAALVAAPRAVCADDAATKLAKKHYDKGEKLFALGRFDTALDEYQKAFDSKPVPAFLFNIGQCYRNLGDFESAVFSFKKYLKLEPDAPNRDKVEKLIDDLEAKQVDPAQGRQATATPTASTRGAAVLHAMVVLDRCGRRRRSGWRLRHLRGDQELRTADDAARKYRGRAMTEPVRRSRRRRTGEVVR